MLQVTELNLDSARSTNIQGLTDEFKNLTSLSLNNVGLTTLKGFPSLPKLKKVRRTSFLGLFKLFSLIIIYFSWSCVTTDCHLVWMLFKDVKILQHLPLVGIRLRTLKAWNHWWVYMFVLDTGRCSSWFTNCILERVTKP